MWAPCAASRAPRRWWWCGTTAPPPTTAAPGPTTSASSTARPPVSGEGAEWRHLRPHGGGSGGSTAGCGGSRPAERIAPFLLFLEVRLCLEFGWGESGTLPLPARGVCLCASVCLCLHANLGRIYSAGTEVVLGALNGGSKSDLPRTAGSCCAGEEVERGSREGGTSSFGFAFTLRSPLLECIFQSRFVK